MAQYNLGKVSIRPRGAYVANTNYEFLDSVQNLGGSWLALAASKNVQPGVTAGWQNYWMMLTKGLSSIVGTSPADGQSLLTFTFSDGSTATYTYDHAPIADDSVTDSKIADNAVITRTIKDGAVTRAKLANDTLYSPNVLMGSTAARTLGASDIGKTLIGNISSINYVITLNKTDDIPVGAEFAFYRMYGKSFQIKCGSTVKVGILGESALVAGATFSLPDQFGMMALKKIETYNGYDTYAVTGNVEVVT